MDRNRRQQIDALFDQMLDIELSRRAEVLATLCVGEDDGMVQLWTASPLQPTAALGQHEARVKSVAFSPDGNEVVSAGDDKMIALWNVSRRKQITTIGLHSAPVYAVAFSHNGKQIVSGGHDHSVRLYTRHRSLWGRPWE